MIPGKAAITYTSSRPPEEVRESDWVNVYGPNGSLVRIEGPIFELTEWTEDGYPTWLMHEQAWTTTPEGEHVEVDAGMVSALQSIWGLGFRTLYSCEGTATEPAYVMFPTALERDRFASEVLWQTSHEISNRSVYINGLASLVSALDLAVAPQSGEKSCSIATIWR